MNLNLVIIVLLAISSASLSAQPVNDSVFQKRQLQSFNVTDVAGNKKELNESSKRFSLFIFLSPECPLCSRYSPVLKKLYEQFHAEVEFYGIVPGKSYSVADVRKYGNDNTFPFTLLIDENKELSNYLRASVTPQVILLDRDYKLVYKGAIDNWLVKLGKQRPKATESFLSNAISQSLDNQIVSLKRTKAVGCRINDY